MLDVFRRNSQSLLIYLIFGAIIVVFAINFGPGSGSGGGLRGPWAASVNGDTIREQDFVLTYNRRLDNLRRNAQQSGQEFSTEMAERLGLKKQVIDQLVNRKLLVNEAKRWNLRISDKDLLKYLEENYGVKDVDYTTYETWVHNNFQLTVPRFEEDVREDIASQRFIRVLTDTLTVSDDEVKNQFMLDNDKAMVFMVEFPSVDKTKTSEADKQAFESKAKSDAEAMLQKLKGGAKIEEVTLADTDIATDKPKRKESGWLKKGDIQFFGLGESKALHDVVFALSKEHAVADQVVKVGDNYVVVALKDRQMPDVLLYESQKTLLHDQALMQKKNKVLGEWIESLKKSAKVELNPALFADASAKK